MLGINKAYNNKRKEFKEFDLVRVDDKISVYKGLINQSAATRDDESLAIIIK